MNQFSKYKLSESMNFNILKEKSKTFEECFYTKLQEIINRSINENLKIYISWSGGVDSSAIVCGLMEYGIKNINILYHKNSINEFKLLYDILIKENINLIDITNDNGIEYQKAIQDGLLITGWCADQLFDSVITIDYPDYYNMPYEKWINHYSEITNVDYTETIWQSESAIKYYGIPIKTFGQWAWFINFFCKWNFIKFSPYSIVNNLSDRIINFYDTIDFQKWVINNIDNINYQTQFITEYYKLPIKYIIEKYTKDTNYTKHKGKARSWINYSLSIKEKGIIIITDTTEKIYPTKITGNHTNSFNYRKRLMRILTQKFRRET